MLGLLIIFSTAALALAGPGVQSTLQQPGASPSLARPYRELVWGDVNIIHTTDTHGWLAGHLKREQPEPNYSGDWGDFQSFVTRMKAQAQERGVDLLLVDSGDHHDGNGLSDAESKAFPNVVRGTTADDIFAQVPFDVLTNGNHELYDFDVARNVYESFAPRWNGSYLASNTDIVLDGRSRPYSDRYRSFVTERGRKVVALGVLYRFKDAAKGIKIQPASEMVHEEWFGEAMAEQPDLFILSGHMSIRDADWKVVLEAVRDRHPTTPVFILGGHVHIRDCNRPDDYTISLGSGRYFETIGWTSMNLSTDGPSFDRRYLDQNRVSYAFHAGEDFDTSEGIATSRRILDASRAFNISYAYGTAPRSFYASRVRPDSPSSLLGLLSGPDGVLDTVVRNPSRPGPPLVAINTGGIRADVFKGVFTVNDQFIALPFANRFLFVPDVPHSTASKLLHLLNSGHSRSTGADDEVSASCGKGMDYPQSTFDDDDDEPVISPHRHQIPLRPPVDRHPDDGQTYGYVTHDSCGPEPGDDVVHRRLPQFHQPDYVATALPDLDLVDFVFFDFIQKEALAALNKAQSEREYTGQDVGQYTSVKANELLGLYASQVWK